MKSARTTTKSRRKGSAAAARKKPTKHTSVAATLPNSSGAGKPADPVRTRTGQFKAPDHELGRGRSGVVYRSTDESGNVIARKVFGASGVTKIVQYALLGAPNPYAWCEPAIRCAVLRRRILAELVPLWFGAKLRVARALGHRWNHDAGAFEMQCELVQGRHVALNHPYSPPTQNEHRDAVHNVMRPLQCHLVESGFDGLVWQAGRGNPVALNNFMCDGVDSAGECRWVWIDLESGVPALIPINPLDLLSFYLPKSVRHRGPLFDDVDIYKLRRYIGEHRDALLSHMGHDRAARVAADVEELGHQQGKWKSLPRHQRSIACQCATASITKTQARWYACRPFHWYGREAKRAVSSIPSATRKVVVKCAGAIARFNPGRILKGTWLALRSQEYRERLSRDYVSARIDSWSARGQLSAEHTKALRHDLDTEQTNSYLTDFGVHLAIKPLVKTAEIWVVPTLWLAGAVSTTFLATFLVVAGPTMRTLYTLLRMISGRRVNQQLPTVALVTGTIPVLGNMAYPLQIIFTGSREHRAVARFILSDTLSRMGQWFPIWGGADTRTEHLFNRCANLNLFRRNEKKAEHEAVASDSPAVTDTERSLPDPPAATPKPTATSTLVS